MEVDREHATGHRGNMLMLTLSFPALAGYPHPTWDPIEFRDWAFATCHAKSEWCAALFVAGVWNTNLARQMSMPRAKLETAIEKGRGFDVLDAIACWDDGNRRAFAQWARAPWFA
jgi:hypothetical protein